MSDFAQKNREHFNATAANYNSKFEKTISALIAEIQARRDWIGVDWISDSSDEDENEETASSPTISPGKTPDARRTVRLLDYACGTGLVSRALAPYITQSIGIDVSEKMVEAYNLSATNQGLPAHEMHAVVGDLLSPTTDSPPQLSGASFHNFDIAVVGLGFHHFEDPTLAAQRLAQRLKSGGVLCIVDFLPHDHHDFHGVQAENARHTVKHMGFSEGDVREMFERAGCGGGFEYVVVGSGVVFVKAEGEREESKRSVFMARGTKA